MQYYILQQMQQNNQNNQGNNIFDTVKKVKDIKNSLTNNNSNLFQGFANRDNLNANQGIFNNAIANNVTSTQTPTLSNFGTSEGATVLNGSEGLGAVGQNVAETAGESLGSALGGGVSASGGAGASALAGVANAVPIVAIASAIKGHADANRQKAVQADQKEAQRGMQTSIQNMQQNEALNESNSQPNADVSTPTVGINTQPSNNNFIQGLVNKFQGTPTGYASKLEEPTFAKDDSGFDYKTVYDRNNAQQGQVSTNAQPSNTTKQGVLGNVGSFLTDIKRGYDENANNGYADGNLTNNQISTGKVLDTQREFNPNSPELQQYIKTLQDKGTDQKVIDALMQGKNGGNKEVANWLDSNQDKLYTETPTYEVKDKNVANRIGEFLGTGSRIVKNPNFQGVVGGAVGTMLTGNPMFGVAVGRNLAKERQNTQMYQDALKKQGIDTNTGTFGTIDSNTFKSLYSPKSKDLDREIQRDKLAETIAYQNAMLGIRQQDADTRKAKVQNDKVYQDTKNKIDQYKAHHKGGGSGNTKTQPKGSDLKAIEELQRRGYKLKNGKWTK